MSYKHQHALAIMRAQPFHVGHQKLVSQMLSECEKVTILLGSIQEHGTQKNPFNYTTRKKMIQNIFRDTVDYPRLKVMGVYDINNPLEWGEYVLDFMHESLPDWGVPDIYYAGSNYDAHWFKNSFDKFEIVDRIDETAPFVSGNMIRDMLAFGDRRWQNFIHPNNHHLIEEQLKPKNKIG